LFPVVHFLKCVVTEVVLQRLMSNKLNVCPHCVCQSHWPHLRRPPVTATRPR